MMKEEIIKSKHIHEVGGKVAAATIKAASEALDAPNTSEHPNAVYSSFPPETHEPLDWAIYPVGEKYYTDKMSGKAYKNPKKIETCYWQCRDAQTNRYLCGYFLWLTDLDGISIHLYRAGGSKGQFYNDFDWTGPTRRFRPYVLAYPSVEGPVPTMQWEAAREGIKDGKYLATWKFYRDQAAAKNPPLARRSEEVVNQILAHYKDNVLTTNSAAYRNSMAQYEADRQIIIKEITNLIN
jgi:hypothetical protein